jgi:hypothetical protein
MRSTCLAVLSFVTQAQLAVTTYLVDKLALRAGGEKDEDLADTVGVCTLRVRHTHCSSVPDVPGPAWPAEAPTARVQVGHVERVPPCTLKFDFLVRCQRLCLAPALLQMCHMRAGSGCAGQGLHPLPARARRNARGVQRHWPVCSRCAARDSELRHAS